MCKNFTTQLGVAGLLFAFLACLCACSTAQKKHIQLIAEKSVALNEATRKVNPFSPISDAIIGVVSLVAAIATGKAVRHRRAHKRSLETIAQLTKQVRPGMGPGGKTP